MRKDVKPQYTIDNLQLDLYRSRKLVIQLNSLLSTMVHKYPDMMDPSLFKTLWLATYDFIEIRLPVEDVSDLNLIDTIGSLYDHRLLYDTIRTHIEKLETDLIAVLTNMQLINQNTDQVRATMQVSWSIWYPDALKQIRALLNILTVTINILPQDPYQT